MVLDIIEKEVYSVNYGGKEPDDVVCLVEKVANGDIL